MNVVGLRSLPEIEPGADLARLIVDAAGKEAVGLESGDVVVVTQKIVSKAEGRIVDLRTVKPSAFAQSLAQTWEKDPRQIEVILRETRRFVRMDQGVIVSETHHGFICANAGIDRSNVPGEEMVCLLPVDPDESAARIRRGLGVEVGVIISDTFGRPWREGTTEVAIGVAGFDPLWDYRGRTDAYGYVLRSTEVAVADMLASAAGLVMEKAARVPVAIVRGFVFEPGEGSGKRLLRAPEKDLFR